MIKVRLLLVVALIVGAGCGDNRDARSVTQASDAKTALLGLPCVEAPGKAELLNEKGELALFAGVPTNSLGRNAYIGKASRTASGDNIQEAC